MKSLIKNTIIAAVILMPLTTIANQNNDIKDKIKNFSVNTEIEYRVRFDYSLDAVELAERYGAMDTIRVLNKLIVDSTYKEKELYLVTEMEKVLREVGFGGYNWSETFSFYNKNVYLTPEIYGSETFAIQQAEYTSEKVHGDIYMVNRNHPIYSEIPRKSKFAMQNKEPIVSKDYQAIKVCRFNTSEYSSYFEIKNSDIEYLNEYFQSGLKKEDSCIHPRRETEYWKYRYKSLTD